MMNPNNSGSSSLSLSGSHKIRATEEDCLRSEDGGFNVNVYSGGPWALLIPQPHFKKDIKGYDWVKTLATDALKDFRDESDKQYELVDVDTFVYRPVGEYYLTFTGRQLDAPSDDVFETIQAHIALFQDDPPVKLCRIKPKHPSAPPN